MRVRSSIVLTARHGVIGRGRYHGVSPFCIPATSSSSILHWSDGLLLMISIGLPCAVDRQCRCTRLRIGIKRFRYIVENFLPRQHALWGADLKEVQDILGEIHDLDVLWHTALQLHAFPDDGARSRWHDKIVDQRNRRLDRYRQRMTGRQSLWQQWRLELPQQSQIQFGALSRVRVWAGFLDPHPKHSHHVSALALEIFHGLSKHELIPAKHERSLELILQIAALAHDIGSSRNKHSRPKASAKLLRRMESPLGWIRTKFTLPLRSSGTTLKNCRLGDRK